jgi:hypothetical protein
MLKWMIRFKIEIVLLESCITICVLLCRPQSLNYPNSKATGADMALPTFLQYAKDAGLPKIDKLPIEHLLWNFHCVS